MCYEKSRSAPSPRFPTAGPSLVWFVVVAATSLLLPAYNGQIDNATVAGFLLPVYAVVAVLAGVGVRKRAESPDEAVLSALPAVLLVAAAALGGTVGIADEEVGERGGPILLYFGATLLASWGALVLSTALWRGIRWGGPAGLVLSVLVALLGFYLFSVNID